MYRLFIYCNLVLLSPMCAGRQGTIGCCQVLPRLRQETAEPQDVGLSAGPSPHCGGPHDPMENMGTKTNNKLMF